RTAPRNMALLIPAIDVHQAKLGRVPHLVAADAGFYSAKNAAAAHAKGVKRVCIPIRSPRAPLASASRRSDGSVTASDGAPGASDASASASAAMVSTVAAIEVMMDAALGRSRRDRRQPDQCRPRHRQTVSQIAIASQSPRT